MDADICTQRLHLSVAIRVIRGLSDNGLADFYLGNLRNLWITFSLFGCGYAALGYSWLSSFLAARPRWVIPWLPRKLRWAICG